MPMLVEVGSLAGRSSSGRMVMKANDAQVLSRTR
jgi:hypothetical protein